MPDYVGMWLSLVEHLVRDQGVAGSNPVIPTMISKGYDFPGRNLFHYSDPRISFARAECSPRPPPDRLLHLSDYVVENSHGTLPGIGI